MQVRNTLVVVLFIYFSFVVVTTHALGNFSTSGHHLHTKREAFCTVQHLNYVYVIGGYTGIIGPNPSTNPIDNGYTNTVEYFNVDDTLGTVHTATSLNVARQSAGCVVVPPHIYVFGGESFTEPDYSLGSSYYNSFEFAQIHADGSLGVWQLSSSTFPTRGSSFPIYDVQSSSVFFLQCGTGSNPTYHAAVHAEGGLGAFTQLTSAPAYEHEAFILLGRDIFGVGGVNVAVESAKIHDDGTLSSFTTVSSLTAIRYSFSIGYSKSQRKLFVVGGEDANGYLVDNVEAAVISRHGVGAFAVVPHVSLQTPVCQQGGGLYRGKLVTIGGDVNDIFDGANPTAIIQIADVL